MKIPIIFGLILGIMAFPMITIPLMGIGVVGWALYILGHDIIWSELHKK